MAQADALSRRPDHVLDEDHDNEDVMILSNSISLTQSYMKVFDTLHSLDLR
jgi:hypothetical protein